MRVRRLLFTRAVCVPCAARESQDTSKAARLDFHIFTLVSLMPLASFWLHSTAEGVDVQPLRVRAFSSFLH